MRVTLLTLIFFASFNAYAERDFYRCLVATNLQKLSSDLDTTPEGPPGSSCYKVIESVFQCRWVLKYLLHRSVKNSF
jgi:hypothetical protein